MAVTSKSTSTWLEVFGTDATGATAQERAATSNVKFVRSQDEIAEWSDGATGRTFTANEALAYFGEETLRRIYEDGSAILPPSPSEPARTPRARREALGWTQEELAKFATPLREADTKRRVALALTTEDVRRAESPDFSNSIHMITQLAIALGLNDAVIGSKPGADGDDTLAIRLKAWSQVAQANPRSVAAFTDTAWVIATQHRLESRIGRRGRLSEFKPSDDYGNAASPVWEVAAKLAAQTRRKLGIGPHEPIASMRQVCYTLGVPLIDASLSEVIAGATLATGGTRGIVANVNGNGGNVWVQRATIAHELGHLLWDPAAKLKALVVDDRRQVEVIDFDPSTNDWVEPRANAFAVEFIAPKEAIRSSLRDLNITDPDSIATAVRESMERFGLSATAMRYHLWNAFDRNFDVEHLPYIDPEPTFEWDGAEKFTDDYFVLPTPLNRRGHFAGVVAKAEEQGWLTVESAAFYLNARPEEYIARRSDLLGLYAM